MNKTQHLSESEWPMSERQPCELQPSNALKFSQHYWQISRPTKHHVNIDGQLKPSIVGQVKQQGHSLHTNTKTLAVASTTTTAATNAKYSNKFGQMSTIFANIRHI